MIVLIAVYLLTVVLTFIAAALDFKSNTGYVNVKDVCFIAVMSLIPIGNIGIVIVAAWSVMTKRHSKFFNKQVF